MDEIKNKFWAVGGGKGGVGKSIVSLLLGSSLARQGKKVVLVDADLGGSNLHTLAGIRYPLCTLADFISRKVENIEEVLIDTPVDNLKLICGADDILGIANPKNTQKTRLFNHLKKLEADFILLDLGAGTSFTSMDFFLYAPNKIVVLTPQITSIQNAYGFIKSSFYRHLKTAFSKDYYAMELINRASTPAAENGIDSVEKLREGFKALDEELQKKLENCLDNMNIKFIVNMIRNSKERDVGNIVKTVSKNYLSLSLESLGLIQYDKILGMSINNMPEFLNKKRDSIASTSFYDIARNVIRSTPAPVKTVTVEEPQIQQEDSDTPEPAGAAIQEEPKIQQKDSDTPTPS
jgi:flagellar biosynthesis protein FlhG